jgi:hypothetical protein
MRRIVALTFVCLLGTLLTLGCGDGGDDEQDSTPADGPSGSPTAEAPPASPTIEAGIVIDKPTDGEEVRAPIAMSGRANVFEGALTIDALDTAADLVLCTRHAQATAGTGTEGAWEGVLAFAPPAGAGTIVLRAYTLSPNDGAMANAVERSITLAAMTPPIVITSPVCATEASGSLEVVGESVFFEIPLTLELRDASGEVVSTQRVFADSQGVDRGAAAAPWAATIDLTDVSPGFYDVVIYNRDPGSSAIENEFPVQISVR